MKLLIAIPSNRDWKPAFGMSLATLCIDLKTKGINFDLASVTRTSIVTARHLLVYEALKNESTHILFIDDDMGFNPAAFHYLNSRDVNFIGANCVKRDGTKIPTAMKDGKPITSKGKKGIENVNSIGFGFNLIKTTVFKKIKEPYFQSEWVLDNHTQKYKPLTEDHYFCNLLIKKKIDIHVDHDAAKHVTHWGDISYQETF